MAIPLRARVADDARRDADVPVVDVVAPRAIGVFVAARDTVARAVAGAVAPVRAEILLDPDVRAVRDVVPDVRGVIFAVVRAVTPPDASRGVTLVREFVVWFDDFVALALVRVAVWVDAPVVFPRDVDVAVDVAAGELARRVPARATSASLTGAACKASGASNTAKSSLNPFILYKVMLAK